MRGRLFVVGIGPGQEAWRSPEVSRMIGEATDLVGYSLYLDLIADISAGKIRHDFDLGREEDRVRHAMELAGTGKDVALVCSGDAGIYAMATLVFELLQNGGLSAAAQRIEIAVSPWHFRPCRLLPPAPARRSAMISAPYRCRTC